MKQKIMSEETEFDIVIQNIKSAKGEDVILPAKNIPIANHIPTGNFMLDYALMGGIPEGYATMLYGYESCGKTTLLKKIVGCFQQKHPDKKTVWVDTEGLFDKGWAETLGCDTSKVLVARPDTGNEAVDIIEAVMGAWETGLVVLDSVPACVPKQVIDASAEDDTMGKLAQLMGKMCSKITVSWNRERKRNHWVTFLYTNQFRSKLGFVLGDPRTLPGGRQINHLPSTKLELKGKEVMGKDKYGSEVIEANEHAFKVVKAKHGVSVRNGEFKMIHNPDSDTGIPQGGWDDYKTLCVYAKRMGLVTGGGSSWYIQGVDTKFPNLTTLHTHLKDNNEANLRLRQATISMQRKAMGLPVTPPDGYLLGPIV